MSKDAPYTVTLYVAAPGTPLRRGGTSAAGHMYLSVEHDGKHHAVLHRQAKAEADKAFEGAINPLNNKNDIQSIQASYPHSKFNTEKDHSMPKRTFPQWLISENEPMLEQIQGTAAELDAVNGRSFDSTSGRISASLLVLARRAEQEYGRYREGLLLTLCLGLSACASAAPPSVSCPSTEFAPFLRQFADPTSANVRQQFTADPLEYEVPTHTVRDDVEGQPATQVELKTGDARMRLFPYRHLKQFDLFVPEDVSHDPVALKSMAAGTFNAPVQIEPSEAGGYNVTFGMEYEADTYGFARRQGCWVLTRATNLRD